MSDIPKEVWCRPYLSYDYVEDWFDGSWSNINKGGVKYVRSDRIEQLAAINEELIEEGSVMAQKLDAAEAKLAKAVDALEDISGNGSAAGRNPQLMADKARITLAELKGSNT
jgi:hypothetical protein